MDLWLHCIIKAFTVMSKSFRYLPLFQDIIYFRDFSEEADFLLHFSFQSCIFLYCWVIRSNKSQLSLFFPFVFLRTERLSSTKQKLPLTENFLCIFVRIPRTSRRSLKFVRFSLIVVFEEFVLSNLVVSPLIKPALFPQWVTTY